MASRLLLGVITSPISEPIYEAVPFSEEEITVLGSTADEAQQKVTAYIRSAALQRAWPWIGVGYSKR